MARHGTATARRGSRCSGRRWPSATARCAPTWSHRWSTTLLASDSLDDIGVIQPAIFAMQVALAALWRSWGVEPAAVIGHSMGEVAAAHVAGALNLDDAARVICARARLLRGAARGGAMIAAELSRAEADELIAGHEDAGRGRGE